MYENTKINNFFAFQESHRLKNDRLDVDFLVVRGNAELRIKYAEQENYAEFRFS